MSARSLSTSPLDERYCPWCEYELAGLAAGAACPECGGETDSKARARAAVGRSFRSLWARIVLLISPAVGLIGGLPVFIRAGFIGYVSFLALVLMASGTFVLWRTCRRPDRRGTGWILIAGPVLGVAYFVVMVAAALALIALVLAVQKVAAANTPGSVALLVLALAGMVAVAVGVIALVAWMSGKTTPRGVRSVVPPPSPLFLGRPRRSPDLMRWGAQPDPPLDDHRCPECGYDTTGALRPVVCSECGHNASPEDRDIAAMERRVAHRVARLILYLGPLPALVAAAVMLPRRGVAGVVGAAIAVMVLTGIFSAWIAARGPAPHRLRDIFVIGPLLGLGYSAGVLIAALAAYVPSALASEWGASDGVRWAATIVTVGVAIPAALLVLKMTTRLMSRIGAPDGGER